MPSEETFFAVSDACELRDGGTAHGEPGAIWDKTPVRGHTGAEGQEPADELVLCGGGPQPRVRLRKDTAGEPAPGSPACMGGRR